jgi:cation transport ATPase
VTLAMTGVLNPLLAAILMPLSSLTVILSSYRARTFTATAPAGSVAAAPIPAEGRR